MQREGGLGCLLVHTMARCEGARVRVVKVRVEKVRAAVALATVSLMAQAAFAQDSFRQTVVVTAAARPVELGTVARRMTIITREQIARLPVQSVADALRLAASIDVRMRGVAGVQSDFAVRGANFGQMLVLVDGVRLNDAQSGHHNGDIPVPLDAVERIEVLYGPGLVTLRRRRVRRHGQRDHAAHRGAAGARRRGRQFRVRRRYEVRLDSSAAVSARRCRRSVDRSSGFMYDRDYKNDNRALAHLARRQQWRLVLASLEGIRRE